jgi:outer membrane lipoprotein carrier protein
MSRWLIICALGISTAVFASPKSELSERLSKNEGFSADFSQTVTAPDGEVIQEAKGTAEIARPNMFRWFTDFPDESELVSDGSSVWFYEPFMEQVSIFSQEQATGQTPFVLLTRDRKNDWDNYEVKQKDNRFVLKPVDKNTTQGLFVIEVTGKGKIESFSVIDQDGQTSEFTFTSMNLSAPSEDTFTFTPPEGVEVYDERDGLSNE